MEKFQKPSISELILYSSSKTSLIVYHISSKQPYQKRSPVSNKLSSMAMLVPIIFLMRNIVISNVDITIYINIWWCNITGVLETVQRSYLHTLFMSWFGISVPSCRNLEFSVLNFKTTVFLNVTQYCSIIDIYHTYHIYHAIWHYTAEDYNFIHFCSHFNTWSKLHLSCKFLYLAVCKIFARYSFHIFRNC